jgi:tRNA-2-methylthio-N6-dimethylallyladenosine synthase
MNRKLIEAMASLEKVCPQLNLPVQSGDDGILEAMKRGYTVEQYRRLVGRIRASMPDVSLSTDVIVGFPGESPEQFQGTFSLLRELRFDSLHTAAYSPRPGTFAAREYEDNITTAEKKKRLQTVEQLQQEIATGINARLLDKTVEVLIEGRKKGKWYGRSRGGKLVFTSHSGDLMGQVIKVRVKKTSPWSLQGEIE